LTAAGATGGPVALSNQAFHIGINDVLGGDPTGAPFSTHVFSVYDAWATQTGNAQAAARASIARGQNIFNTRTFSISGVRGVNDVLGVTSLQGTCTTCHDAPNAGDHSVGLPLDLGLTDPDKFNTDTTPRYTLRNKTTGATIRTSDPGRSLIDGKWGHVATFKGPILRGLAPRAPYFHNGFAATLTEVVHFYDTRFHLGLTSQDVADLSAFLAAL
jgi:cytochrome c peroxidase